uniref:Uncharacterized protein n=1 Tax=Fagus sylvatica TaxID=28930 RepID=A0A2N9GEY0_FAGSY
MAWLGNTIDMAASKNTGGEFFRHHRDGYKAIHAIRRSNQHGQYLEISEFHSGSRKGVIRIPAGLEQQGWAQFSLFCKGHQKNATLPQPQITNECRREVARTTVMNKVIEGGKPQIKPQDIIFQKHVTDSGNKAKGVISVDMPKDMVNSRVQLNLELELGRGPDGTWVISRAKLQTPEPTRTHLTKPISHSAGPSIRPVSQQVWRPKIQPIKRTHQNPQNTMPPEASTKAECSTPEPCTSDKKARDTAAVPTNSDDVSKVGTWAFPLLPNPFYALIFIEVGYRVNGDSSFGDEVTRTWGSSSDWVLELRDGKTISIPLSLIRQPSTVVPCIPDSTEEPKVLLLEGFDDMGSSEGQVDSEEDDDEEEDVSVVWEDPELSKEGGMVVCCEENDRPLEIEPLAALLPSSHLPELRSDEARDTIPPSEWVLGKYKEFGEYIGASYEGYEEEVIQLL